MILNDKQKKFLYWLALVHYDPIASDDYSKLADVVNANTYHPFDKNLLNRFRTEYGDEYKKYMLNDTIT